MAIWYDTWWLFLLLFLFLFLFLFVNVNYRIFKSRSIPSTLILKYIQLIIQYKQSGSELWHGHRSGFIHKLYSYMNAYRCFFEFRLTHSMFIFWHLIQPFCTLFSSNINYYDCDNLPLKSRPIREGNAILWDFVWWESK